MCYCFPPPSPLLLKLIYLKNGCGFDYFTPNRVQRICVVWTEFYNLYFNARNIRRYRWLCVRIDLKNRRRPTPSIGPAHAYDKSWTRVWKWLLYHSQMPCYILSNNSGVYRITSIDYCYSTKHHIFFFYSKNGHLYAYKSTICSCYARSDSTWILLFIIADKQANNITIIYRAQ